MIRRTLKRPKNEGNRPCPKCGRKIKVKEAFYKSARDTIYVCYRCYKEEA